MQPSSDIQTNLTCWSSAKSAEVCYKLQRGIRQTLRVQVYYYHRYQWYECSTSCKFQSDKQDTFVQLYKCIIGCISVLVLDNQCIGGMFLHWVGQIGRTQVYSYQHFCISKQHQLYLRLPSQTRALGPINRRWKINDWWISW